MPKNTVHGGPTNKADYPPTFGSALAAARTELLLPPVEDNAGKELEHPGIGVEMHGVEAVAGGTWTTLVADPERVVAVSLAAFQELRDRLFAAGSEGAPLGTCPSCGADIEGWAHSAGVAEVEPEEGDTWVRRVFTGERQVSVQPCGHVFPEPKPTAVEVTAGPEGGEQPSPGNSSSTLRTKRQPRSSEPKVPSQSRAPRTGSRSRKPAGNSTAASADDTATNSSTDNA